MKIKTTIFFSLIVQLLFLNSQTSLKHVISATLVSRLDKNSQFWGSHFFMMNPTIKFNEKYVINKTIKKNPQPKKFKNTTSISNVSVTKNGLSSNSSSSSRSILINIIVSFSLFTLALFVFAFLI